jgi:transcription elongation factor GreA
MKDTTYLTAEGAAKLKEELEFLKGTRREEIAKRLRFAIEQGDLSENADYSAAKEDQSFVEGRIMELETVLSNVKIIEELVHKKGIVNIGSFVTIQEDDFEPEVYQIVGPQEADPTKGKISYESPIGSALYQRKVKDKVVAETPNGKIEFKILEIK